MKLTKFYCILFLVYAFSGTSQTPGLSPLSKISVLTCGPGTELYSTFGHSAFRVEDPSLGIDVVYNYGVFDFESGHFYWNFAKGRLNYTLARQSFVRFLDEYKYENRWVVEQTLNISLVERNTLFKFLETNYLPENRVYQYDFFYNNCSTKIWDVLQESFNKKLVFDDKYLDHQYTFRQLIHQNLTTNSWSAFGIDLALGSVIDRTATPEEHLFLPNYVMRQLTTSKFENHSLALKKRVLYQSIPAKTSNNFLITPLFFLLVFMGLTLTITYFDYKNKTRRRWFDFTLFFITGAAGLVIFFLWFMTDHIWTVANYNILWAFPLNIVIAFYMLQKSTFPAFLVKFIGALLVMMLSTIILWMLKVQIFSPLTIPIFILLSIRYAFLVGHEKILSLN
ncbi:MAG: DUF4105 domain-containing protein [Maribacter sp.]|nr:DUF4105 domain-containing protein [Maribacter sp.]